MLTVNAQSRALRLDQEKGPSTPFQRPPYHSALIPGTRANCRGAGLVPMRKHIEQFARGIAQVEAPYAGDGFCRYVCYDTPDCHLRYPHPLNVGWRGWMQS